MMKKNKKQSLVHFSQKNFITQKLSFKLLELLNKMKINFKDIYTINLFYNNSKLILKNNKIIKIKINKTKV